MIVIIDYNVGNVKNVENALRFLGVDSALSADAEAIAGADGIILPGVAAFGYAMRALGETAAVVREAALGGKPLLGICVGYQLLFEGSVEMGTHRGLGLVDGQVVPIPADLGLTIPHMGWNDVRFGDGMDLFDGLGEHGHFYFAHSFHAEVSDGKAKVAWTEYGKDIAASVQKGNIFGVQFHPEKSSDLGMRVLRNFAAVCEGRAA